MHAANDTLDLFAEMDFAAAPPPAVMVAAGGAMSEVSPGVWVSGLPEFETPSHILCRLVPAGQGLYTLEPEPWPGYIRMTEDIGARLGILGLSETTVRRLMWGGFLEHFVGSPGCTYISLESFASHLQVTRNDAAREVSFWTRQRRLAWQATCDGGAASR